MFLFQIPDNRRHSYVVFPNNKDFECRPYYIYALALMFFQLHFNCDLENIFDHGSDESPSVCVNPMREAVSLEERWKF